MMTRRQSIEKIVRSFILIGLGGMAGSLIYKNKVAAKTECDASLTCGTCPGLKLHPAEVPKIQES